MKGAIKLKNKSSILRYFSPDIKVLLEKIIDGNKHNIHEIRLRCEKPLSVTSYGRTKYISAEGILSDFIPDNFFKVTKKDIDYTFQSVCDYSIHSYENEISQGFITVCGGHRAGFAGSAVIYADRVSAVKYINSVNFRIASEINGCADTIFSRIFRDKPYSTLIIGVPASGKTTVLRDLCRQLSEKYCVSVIDERGEIGAVYHGEPQNDVGVMCDVFDGYPKAYGLQTALRVMSPDIAICDEIGGDEEVNQLLSCVNAGVKIIASAHAGSLAEIYRRKNIRKLIENSVFEYIVLLGGKEKLGTVEAIVRVSEYDSKTAWHNDGYIGIDACGYCDILRAVQASQNSGTADKSCR